MYNEIHAARHILYGILMEPTQILYILIAFMLGYMVRGALSFLYMAGKSASFVQKVTFQVQQQIITVAQDIEFIKEAKHSTLVDAGVDKNLIIRESNMDKYNHEKWKTMIVKTYVDEFPDEFRKHLLSFHDWQSMVDDFNTKRSKR